MFTWIEPRRIVRFQSNFDPRLFWALTALYPASPGGLLQGWLRVAMGWLMWLILPWFNMLSRLSRMFLPTPHQWTWLCHDFIRWTAWVESYHGSATYWLQGFWTFRTRWALLVSQSWPPRSNPRRWGLFKSLKSIRIPKPCDSECSAEVLHLTCTENRGGPNIFKSMPFIDLVFIHQFTMLLSDQGLPDAARRQSRRTPSMCLAQSWLFGQWCVLFLS